jgi:hypothetical protein
MCTGSAITEFVMKKVRRGKRVDSGGGEREWKDTGI